MRKGLVLFIVGAALTYWLMRPVEAQLIFSKAIPPIGIGGGSFSGGGGVTGSCGTANALGKFTASTTLACSSVVDSGTIVSTTEQLQLSNGTAAAPGLIFALTTAGFVGNAAGPLVSLASTLKYGFIASTVTFAGTSDSTLCWTGVTNDPTAACDTSEKRDHAGGYRFTSNATAPTATACGTSPTVAGNDSDGVITVGTTPSTTCTLTFNASWGAAPVCVALDYNTAETIKGVPGTASWPMTFSATLTAADTIGYHCVRAN